MAESHFRMQVCCGFWSKGDAASFPSRVFCCRSFWFYFCIFSQDFICWLWHKEESMGELSRNAQYLCPFDHDAFSAAKVIFCDGPYTNMSCEMFQHQIWEGTGYVLDLIEVDGKTLPGLLWPGILSQNDIRVWVWKDFKAGTSTWVQRLIQPGLIISCVYIFPVFHNKAWKHWFLSLSLYYCTQRWLSCPWWTPYNLKQNRWKIQVFLNNNLYLCQIHAVLQRHKREKTLHFCLNGETKFLLWSSVLLLLRY